MAQKEQKKGQEKSNKPKLTVKEKKEKKEKKDKGEKKDRKKKKHFYSLLRTKKNN